MIGNTWNCIRFQNRAWSLSRRRSRVRVSSSPPVINEPVTSWKRRDRPFYLCLTPFTSCRASAMDGFMWGPQTIWRIASNAIMKADMGTLALRVRSENFRLCRLDFFKIAVAKPGSLAPDSPIRAIFFLQKMYFPSPAGVSRKRTGKRGTKGGLSLTEEIFYIMPGLIWTS